MAELTKEQVRELVLQALKGIDESPDFNPFDDDMDAEQLATYFDITVQSLAGTEHGPAYAVEYGVFEDMTQPYACYYSQVKDFDTRAEAKRYGICYVVARMQSNKNRNILG